MLRGVGDTISAWVSSLASYGRSGLNIFTKIIHDFGITLSSYTFFSSKDLSDRNVVEMKESDFDLNVLGQASIGIMDNLFEEKPLVIPIKGVPYLIIKEHDTERPEKPDGSIWDPEAQEVISYKWGEDHNTLILFTKMDCFVCSAQSLNT